MNLTQVPKQKKYTVELIVIQGKGVGC